MERREFVRQSALALECRTKGTCPQMVKERAIDYEHTHELRKAHQAIHYLV